MTLLSKFSPRNFDWYIFASVAVLASVGLVAIYSVDLSRGSGLLFFRKQIISAGIGLFFLFAFALAQPSLWQRFSKLIYFFSVSLLVLVLAFGNVVRGAKSWFSFFGFSFQPAEFAKVALVLMMAFVATNFGRRFDRPLFFYGTALLAIIPACLVIAQPDLGSATIIGAIWFGIMLVLKTRKLHVASILALIAIVAVMGWFFLLKDYQKDRLITFVDPGRDPLGSGYNITQSVIAVGAGKMFGRGLGFGSQSQLHFLPEAQTDFIFSVIGEELGFAGSAVLMAVFMVLFTRLLIMAKRSNNDFAAICAYGALIMFFVQFVTNMGASIGLLPITGVTLPFVSYGGSSLVISMMFIGILQSLVSKKY
ncbi:MAG: rod shape-determining protein RodA [bacterium]